MEQQNFFYLVLLHLLKYVKDFEDYGLNKDHNDNNNDKKKIKKQHKQQHFHENHGTVISFKFS